MTPIASCHLEFKVQVSKAKTLFRGEQITAEFFASFKTIKPRLQVKLTFLNELTLQSHSRVSTYIVENKHGVVMHVCRCQTTVIRTFLRRSYIIPFRLLDRSFSESIIYLGKFVFFSAYFGGSPNFATINKLNSSSAHPIRICDKNIKFLCAFSIFKSVSVLNCQQVCFMKM